MKFVLAQLEDQNMERSRRSEEQIIGILRRHESGVAVADLCRKHGVSDASVYNWKQNLAGWRSRRQSGCGDARMRVRQDLRPRPRLGIGCSAHVAGGEKVEIVGCKYRKPKSGRSDDGVRQGWLVI